MGNAMQAQLMVLGVAHGPISFNPATSLEENDVAVEALIQRAIDNAVDNPTVKALEHAEVRITQVDVRPYAVMAMAYAVVTVQVTVTGG